jgi:hypothetical protein
MSSIPVHVHRAPASPTIPRLSKNDKDKMAQEDKPIFVVPPPPKTVTNKWASHQNVLMKFLIDQRFTGISYRFPSAASFIAVFFKTTENRDNAMA